MDKENAVVLTVHLWPEEGESRTVYESLKRIEEPTRAHRGCRDFGVFRACDGPAEVLLVGVWEDRGALEAHVRSSDFRVVLSALDASRREPSFRVDTVASTAGFEQVAEILGERAR